MCSLIEEGFVLCPYDSSHVVGKLRIQNHIVKCQKNNPNVKLATCLYNYTHKVKPEQMVHHYEICPDKSMFEEIKLAQKDCSTQNSASENFNEYLPAENSLTAESVICGSKIPSSIDFSKNICGWIESVDLADKIQDGEKMTEEKVYEDCDTNSYLSSSEYTDEILEPLPLPKIPSKAFTFGKKNKSDVSSVGAKGFGKHKISAKKQEEKIIWKLPPNSK